MPLWLVTCGAQQGDALAIPVSWAPALWGFARVLLNEMPRLRLHLVDFALALTEAECAERLTHELAASTAETEIVWTGAGRHVLRLRRGLPPRWAVAADRLALASEHLGGLDALGWKLAAPRDAGPGR